MSSYFLIPKTNPIDFVEENLVSSDYNPLHNRFNYAHTQRPGIAHRPYFQPWIQGDTINLQFWLKDIAELYIDMVSCEGAIVRSYKRNPYGINFTETDNGNNTQDVTMSFTAPSGINSVYIAYQDSTGAYVDYSVGAFSPQTITVPVVGNLKYRATFFFASRIEYYYSELLPNTALVLGGISYDIQQFRIDTIATPPQDFYFRIQYRKNGSVFFEKPWISEPQRIHGSIPFPSFTLPESILFKYSNSYNEYNTIYKTPFASLFDQVFFLRVEGGITYNQPENNTISYDDQRMDKTLLDAKPYDSYHFFIGTKFGIPAWMAAKINMVRSHDTVIVEDRQWAFIDNWEKKPVEGYDRAYYNIIAVFAQTNYFTAVGSTVAAITGGGGGGGGGGTGACEVPANISFSGIDSANVHVDWNVINSNGLGYQYELYEAQTPGVPVRTGSTLFNYLDIGGLQSGTDYQFFVRSICGASTFSAWAGTVQDPSFTTL